MKLDLSNHIDKQKAMTYMDKLMEHGAKIEIKEFKSKRTLSQNAYMHVCFTYVAQATGYSIEETKTVLKREFGSFMIYEKNSEKFLRTTADLDKEETIYLIDWIRNFAQDQLGTYIPTSEEYLQNQFYIERDLQYVK